MKTRFNSYDIICGVTELQKLVGLRVNQIFDIDNKTYLIRLQGGESKIMLLIESGVRFHTTAFEWPKNMTPSGFSMKLRKHLKNKRLEKLQQLGMDRIVDFQFGTGDVAYHVIVELYDRGNIILTDHELTILYILRPHYEGEEVRFAVREKYPTNRAKEQSQLPTEDDLRQKLSSIKTSESLRRILMPFLDCGPAVIDHVLVKYKLDNCVVEINKNLEVEKSNLDLNEKKSKKEKKKINANNKAQPFDMNRDLSTLMTAIQEAETMLLQAKNHTSKGYIIQKKEEKATTNEENKEYFYQNIEYHPYLFEQFLNEPKAEFNSFMLAVDEFFSTLKAQKIDLKVLQDERDALKKLSNVKKDHEKRLDQLNKAQEDDKQKADLITNNQEIVDKAILAVRSAIASQMSWDDIRELVSSAKANGDPIAAIITKLKFESNHISLKLADPYSYDDDDDDDDNDGDIDIEGNQVNYKIVDIDLSLSAWANARKYYDLKRSAAQKEQKTIDASQKALKSAERKTQQTLKDVRTISTISKARKVYWFEKFYWFISSENYLVIGGRDAQQNELIVKRYMRPADIYVHAEIQGASSVIIRNPGNNEIPPKTLLEAGTMAISYSVAWDAKVVTNAYWVHSDQVSKTAPSGEYLGTGSFMVRGKKNFLPSCHLVMGISLLFKLEDSFVESHRGERRVRTFDEENFESTEERLTHLTVDDISSHNSKSDDDEDNELQLNDEKEEDIADKYLDTVDEEETSYFPDTQVKIEHDTGRVTIRTDSITDANADKNAVVENVNTNAEDATLIPAMPARKKQQQNAKKRKEEKVNKAKNNYNQHLDTEKSNSSSQSKRGQKGKLKKIKAKYSDQDEEERKLRMQILQASNKSKIVPVDPKDEENSTSSNKPKVSFEQKKPVEIDDGDDVPADADLEMLDTLTGQPFEEDELLFVVPVVAPYQALQQYKYKIKVTPGTGKRGRAAKTALTMFSSDKHCTTREKDLLKSIKDEVMARNIPGKVKLSSANLQKSKK